MKKYFLSALFIMCSVASQAQEFNRIGGPIPEGLGPSQGMSGTSISNEDGWTKLTGKTPARLLGTLIGDNTLSVRGPQDIAIYQNAAPSVVMVVSDDGPKSPTYRLGSGSYLGSNQILTNAHVVGSNSVAQILFKPQQEGVKVNPTDVVIANVVRLDKARDLALLAVNFVPPYVRPLALGDRSELQVGADVYAIGHPKSEAWTFTRGLISQIRDDYEWKDESGNHLADVIQTQTPINVGNSGGPLIGISGKLLGVNSFKTAQSEGLNFAVSVKDVGEFLKSTKGDRKLADDSSSCKAVQLYDGRNKANDGRLVQIDTNCDGRADVAVITPDDTSKPIQAFIDTNYDGKIDVTIDDFNRDNLWDVSFHDTHFNGHVDLVGFHPNGDVAPSWYEKYNASKSYTEFRAHK